MYNSLQEMLDCEEGRQAIRDMPEEAKEYLASIKPALLEMQAMLEKLERVGLEAEEWARFRIVSAELVPIYTRWEEIVRKYCHGGVN